MNTPRLRLAIVAAVTMALLAVPVAVSAVAQFFNDVPPTDWAYDEVQWLAFVGLTNGCGGGDYCPDDGVSRREMAVFTNRANDKLIPFTIGVVNESATLLGGTAMSMGQVSFSNAETSIVTLNAAVTAAYNVNGGTAGFSDLAIWTQLDNTTCASPGLAGRGEQSLAAAGVEPFVGTAVYGDAFQIAGGAHSVTVCAAVTDGDGADVTRVSLTGTVSPNPSGNISVTPLPVSSGRGGRR
jgi:S-layer family protein